MEIQAKRTALRFYGETDSWAKRTRTEKRATRFAAGLLLVIMTSFQTAPAFSAWFSEREEYRVPAPPKRLAVGQINGDGFPDVVVGTQLGSVRKALIYINGGDGSYSAQGELPVAAYWWSLCVGDFNGDGLGDVAVSGDPMKVYYQGPAGVFTTPPQQLQIPGFTKAFATSRAADLDGDGADELLGCTPGEPARGRILVYRGSATGLAPSPEELVVNLYEETVECWLDDDYFTAIKELGLGDVDQDGDTDVWFTADYFGSDDGCLRRGLGWYESLGGSEFGGLHWIHRESMQHDFDGYGGAALGLIDGDSFLDWVIYDIENSNSIWLRGTPGNTWESPVFLMTPTGNPTLVDLDQNGVLDLPFLELGVRVYEGEGDGTFSSQEWVTSNHIEHQVIDMNGDSRADIVVAARTVNEFWVYLNQSLAPADAEEIPSSRASVLIASPSVVSRGEVALEFRGVADQLPVTLSSVSVMDASGRIVRNLSSMAPGESGPSWRWDLLEDSGREVQSGVYWARVNETGHSARIVVLRNE